jgi:hypothetical protein
MHLRNLSAQLARTEEEALNLLFLGDTNRVISETPMNQASSRSHCLFTIAIDRRKAGSDVVRRSKLHLVDLAGSERVKKTGIEGNSLKEAKYINLSLHFLEQVRLRGQAQGPGSGVRLRGQAQAQWFVDPAQARAQARAQGWCRGEGVPSRHRPAAQRAAQRPVARAEVPPPPTAFSHPPHAGDHVTGRAAEVSRALPQLNAHLRAARLSRRQLQDGHGGDPLPRRCAERRDHLDLPLQPACRPHLQQARAQRGGRPPTPELRT